MTCQHPKAELQMVCETCGHREAAPAPLDGLDAAWAAAEAALPSDGSRRITQLVSPTPNGWRGEIEIIFQSIESLHAALPHHTGDWYFTGKYPTPGGYRVVNQAYVNYFEKHEGRSY